MNPSNLKIIPLKQEGGSALPSILFLITILSLAATSVIVVNQLRYRLVLRDIAFAKAESASEGGIAQSIADCVLAKENPPETWGAQTLSFGDGTTASVTAVTWGAYGCFRSVGHCGTTESERIAFIGEKMGGEHGAALIFTNLDHQLVLAGSSSIKGDVVMAVPRVSTGSLQERNSPRFLPVQGQIRGNPTIASFRFNSGWIAMELDRYDSLITSSNHQSSMPHELQLHYERILSLSNVQVPDSINLVTVNSNVSISGKICRRILPLTIAVNGRVTFGNGCKIAGLVKIISSQDIVVTPGTIIDGSILYSQKGIILENSASITAQLFADSIVAKSGVTLSYPSIVATLPSRGNQTLTVQSGACIEGTILSFASSDPKKPNLINIEPGGRIIGAVYAENRLTLDGSVSGIIVAREFYFYEAPTMYLGWIRSGTIDRSALPSPFLLPIGFSKNPSFEVLDWL